MITADLAGQRRAKLTILIGAKRPHWTFTPFNKTNGYAMTEGSTKKRTTFWIWLVLLSLLASSVGCLVFLIWGPSPQLILSRETTYIDSPISPNGLPDYPKYLLSQMPNGGQPDDNAAVLYWQAMWPGNLSSAEERKAICSALKMPMPEYAGIGDAYADVDKQLSDWVRRAYLAEQKARNPDEFGSTAVAKHEPAESRAREIYGKAIDGPWTSAQIPPLADWLQINSKKIDLLVAGSARDTYFNPPPNMVDGSNDPVPELLLPGVNMLRDAARVLKLRAMWHLGEGRIDEAWADLKACHQLARHVSSGCFLIEFLIASAIEAMASDGTQTLLHHAALSTDQARRIQRELNALPPFSSPSNLVILAERCAFLDIIARCSAGEAKMGQFRPIINNFQPSDLPARQALDFSRIDWNEIARQGNRWFDRLMEANELPPQQRVQAFKQLRKGSNANKVSLGKMLTMRSRTQLMADQCFGYLPPNMQSLIDPVNRNRTLADLTRIIAALAVHRAEHKSYPGSLNDLVPSAITELPMDIYSEQPYRYLRIDDGFCLYSVGADGVDDHGPNNVGLKGKQTAELASGDDIVVLLPKPPFKLELELK